MGNYNNRNNFSRGNDRGRPEMHRATCADCGNSCEVPFRPNGDKPIYCSSCFGKGDSPSPSKYDQSKPDQSSKKHDEINAKLDKILFLLQRANPVKEVTVMKPKKEEPALEAPKAPKASKASKKAPKKAVKKASAKKAPKKATPKKAAPKKAVKKVATKKKGK